MVAHVSDIYGKIIRVILRDTRKVNANQGYTSLFGMINFNVYIKIIKRSIDILFSQNVNYLLRKSRDKHPI